MNYTEYARNRGIDIHRSRKHRISNSFGLKEYYNHYKSIRPKDIDKYNIDSKTYSLILNAFHNKLIKKLFDTNILHLLYIGEVEIIKYRNAPEIIDGELVYKAKIDWAKTYELWDQDPIERDNKTLVRCMNHNHTFYKFVYNKKNVIIKNKKWYKFSVNRQLRVRLKELIQDDLIECYNGYER